MAAVGAWLRGRAEELARRAQQRTPQGGDGAPPRTLLDAPSVDAVVDLVRRADGGRGGDDLARRLARLYARFPPDEPTLRRLSVLQQRHADGGERAFCCATVYAIAQEERLRAGVPARKRRPAI